MAAVPEPVVLHSTVIVVWPATDDPMFSTRHGAQPFTLHNLRAQQEHWVFMLQHSSEMGVFTVCDSLCQDA